MKKIFLAALVLFLSSIFVFTAQAGIHPVTWTTSITETGFFDINAVAIDVPGNIFVTGTAVFYSGAPGTSQDTFVAKYSSAGKEVWRRYYSTTTWDGGNGVALDSAGNVYVTGYANTTSLWMRKYDTNGNILWTDTTRVSSKGFGICIDKTDNIYTIGTTSGGAFIDKYTSAGAFTRGTTISTVGVPSYSGVQKMGIAVDTAGTYIYATAGIPTGFTGSNLWSGKFDATNLSIIWNKTLSVDNGSFGSGIAVDSAGDLYIAGYAPGVGSDGNLLLGKYSGSDCSQIWKKNQAKILAQGITLFNGHLLITGTQDGFLWLNDCDTAGTTLAEQIYTYKGKVASDSGYGITTDSTGNILVVGQVDYYSFLEKFGADITVTQAGNSGYFKIVGGKDGYVNPSKSETSNFLYKATEAGTITFKVYNSRGNLCRTVSSIATGPLQVDSFVFDCRTDAGEFLASGIYMVKAEGPGVAIVKKIAILK